MRQERKRVALVDDDPTAAATLTVLLEDAGYEAIEVEPPLESIDGAIDQIRRVASAAICDHRLSPRGLAYFSGAELVAQLYAIAFPAVLISQYFKIDQDVSIRKYRSKIPILLARDEVGPEQLSDAIRVCANEIGGQRLPHRKGWRTLVRVVAKDIEGGEDVLDAIIPAGAQMKQCDSLPDFLAAIRMRCQRGVAIGSNFAFLRELTSVLRMLASYTSRALSLLLSHNNGDTPT